MFISVHDVNDFSFIININQITIIDVNKSFIYMNDKNILHLTNDSMKVVYDRIRGVNDEKSDIYY